MSDIAEQLSKLTGRPKPKRTQSKKIDSKKRKKRALKPRTNSEILTIFYRLIGKINQKDFDINHLLKLASGLRKGTKLNLKPQEIKLLQSIPAKLIQQYKQTAKLEKYHLIAIEKLISKTAHDDFISEINVEKIKQKKLAQEEKKRQDNLRKAEIAKEERSVAEFSRDCNAFFDSFLPSFVPSYIVPSGNEKDERYLNEEDIELILTWNDSSYVYQASSIQHIYDELEYEGVANKLISARYAEKIANIFYKEIGFNPKDLSIQQLDDSKSDWKIADIKINNVFIDVKNARRFRKSGSNYSEQFIKRFKESSKDQDVVYLGTLSKHMGKESLVNEKIGECSVLGEITNKEIAELRQWTQKRFNNILKIELRRGGYSKSKYSTDVGSHIPGWLFEYPKEFYEYEKDSIKTQLIRQDKLDKIINTNLAIKVNPFFYVFCDQADNSLPSGLKKYHNMINALRDTRDSIGLSRRSVFITVLGLVLQSFVNRDDLRPKHFMDIIFYKKNYQHPLGLLDTEEYIYHLIKLLDKIWKNNQSNMKKYSSFKLSGFDILKGFSKDEHWETIYAYCGGKEIARPWMYCRKNPIHLSNSKTCSECRMLICPDCKTCFNQCDAFKKRISKYQLDNNN